MSSYAAFGATLVYDPASTDLTVGQITNISGPGISTDAIDVTTHQSTSATREFLAGLVDGGEVTFEMVYDAEAGAAGGAASGLNIVETKAQDRSLNTWEVVANTSTDYYRRFSAIVTAFSMDNPVDGAITASATLKISGPITTGTA
jgi:predicted secreted protein